MLHVAVRWVWPGLSRLQYRFNHPDHPDSQSPQVLSPLVTMNAAAFLALLLLVTKQAPVSAAIPWLLLLDNGCDPRRLQLLNLQMLNDCQYNQLFDRES